MCDSDVSCPQSYGLSSSSISVSDGRKTDIKAEAEESEEFIEKVEEEEPETVEPGLFLPKLKPFYLTTDDVRTLLFDEKLDVIHKESLNIVGSFKIKTNYCNDGTIMIQCCSKHDTPKKHTKILNMIGFIDEHFNTLAELRKEESSTLLDPSSKSIIFQINLKQNGVTVSNYKQYEDQGETTEYSHFSFIEFSNVISEVANLILLRKLSYCNFIGTLRMKCIFLNRMICETQYKCYNFVKCVRSGVYECPLKKIIRKTKDPYGSILESKAYYTKYGQLILLDWPNSDAFITINSKVRLRAGPPPKNPDDLIPLKKKILQNKYLKGLLEDETNRNRLSTDQYFEDHPDAIAIINFICKQILLRKPHRVVHFAKRCLLPVI